MNSHFTQHALSRIRQRGLYESDIQIILDSGTPVGNDSVLLLDHDVEREVRKLKREIARLERLRRYRDGHKLKREIARLERLRGYRVVLAGDEKVVTVYRPCRKIEKRLLRGTHRHTKTGHPDTNFSFPPFNGGYNHAH